MGESISRHRVNFYLENKIYKYIFSVHANEKENIYQYLYLLTYIEPVHEISNNVVCATSIASDQPAHTRSLIRAFASRLSILWLLSYWLNTIWSF